MCPLFCLLYTLSYHEHIDKKIILSVIYEKQIKIHIFQYVRQWRVWKVLEKPITFSVDVHIMFACVLHFEPNYYLVQSILHLHMHNFVFSDVIFSFFNSLKICPYVRSLFLLHYFIFMSKVLNHILLKYIWSFD